MTRIILHSDDLGITSHVTKHILDAWRAGYLDGFSIIANGDAVKQIPDALIFNSEKKARISVHFNLTEGRSSAAADQIPLLVDAYGQLRHTFSSLLLIIIFSSWNKRRDLFNQIYIECIAQIKVVRSLCVGRTITALDGHNHIHMIPGVFTAVALAAHAEGIPEIRISAEPFFIDNPWADWIKSFWWVNLLKHHLLNFFALYAYRVAKQIGLYSSKAIIGILYSGNMSMTRALSGINAAISKEEIEVLFHIGRAKSNEAKRWKNSRYATFHLSKLRDEERLELYLLAKYIRYK